MHRLTFLFSNVFLDHLVCQIPGADCQVSPRPEITPPKLLPQMGKLLKENPRTDPLEPLHDRADIHVWSIRHQNVNVVARHFAGQYHDLMLHRDLPDQVAHAKRDLTCQHLLPVLWNPDKVHLQIVLRVGAQLVSFHATTLHNPKARLQGGGFPPSLMGTLIHDTIIPHAVKQDQVAIGQSTKSPANRNSKADLGMNLEKGLGPSFIVSVCVLDFCTVSV
jgi:hypothetical protein